MSYTNYLSKPVGKEVSKKIDTSKLTYYAKKTEQAKKEADQVVDLTNEIKELESVKEKLIENINNFDSKITVLENDIKIKNNELLIEKSKITDTKNKNKLAQADYDSFVEDINGAKVIANNSLVTLGKDIENKAYDILSLDKKLEEVDESLEKKQDVIHDLINDINIKNNIIPKLKSEIAVQEETIKEKKGDIKSLDNIIADYTSKVIKIDQSIKEMTIKSNLIDKEQKEKVKGYKKIENDVEKREADVSERENWLSEDRSHLIRVKEDLESTYKIKIKRVI